MKILFLHQNFPGQFKHLAPALAARGHQVVALTSRVEKPQKWKGVTMVPYKYTMPEGQVHHPWLTNLNGAVHRGAVVYKVAAQLADQGFSPDIIVAHSGWGEALFIKEVWPDAKLGVFSEFHYKADGADIGFDPEFAVQNAFGEGARMRMRNLSMRMQFELADAALCPTQWQTSTHPEEWRKKITVVHDGIDTAQAAPKADARFKVNGLNLSRADEVITFVNRNLEPYRGFHIFMRGLGDLLRRRPQAQVIVVGGNSVSYGSAPRDGGTWKDKMTNEVRGDIPDSDWARVHFVGKVPYGDFLTLLQVSTVHLYLSYPFVLSWSLMEAMACECAIVGSATKPVEEVVSDGETGVLFDFFDAKAMVDQVERLCQDPELRATLGRNARSRVMERYDLKTVCLPRQFQWVADLSKGAAG